MYTAYIIFSHTIDRYYIGYTNDIQRRLAEHNRIKGKFTDRGIPWTLVYSIVFENKKEAMERESFLKNKKSRSFLEALISNK